jgi:hypothetical protein
LSLLDQSGNPLQTSASNGIASETINRTLTAGSYYIRVYPRNNGAWNANSCYTLRAGGGTASRGGEGWITANAAKMNLFPNPAGEMINVLLDGMNATAEIKVYNIMGNLVMRKVTNKTNTQLNVSKLPAGVYMVSASDGITTKNSKFVKE